MAKRLNAAKIRQLATKYAARVKRANTRFAKMTESEKRVRLSKDLLAWIEMKKVVAVTGQWLVIPTTRDLQNKVGLETDLKGAIATAPSCNACLLGGMLACAIDRQDAVRLKDIIGPNGYGPFVSNYGWYHQLNTGEHDTFGYLRQFFSLDQLKLMESAFEKGRGYCDVNKGSGYLAHINDPEARMVQICYNIIRNKGTFDPLDTRVK